MRPSIAALLALLLPASVTAETLRTSVGRTLTIQHGGATAAFTVDPLVAEASAASDTVTILGRRPGTTRVVVVAGEATHEYEVTVRGTEKAAGIGGPAQAARTAAATSWDAIYNSRTGRLSGNFETSTLSRGSTTRVRIGNAVRLDGASSTDALVALPSLSLERTSADRQIVLFDQLVRDTPLTLDGTSLRGGHYQDRRLRLHAGIASPLLYQSILLPAGSAAAVGGAYQMTLGRAQVTPSFYYFTAPDSVTRSSGPLGTLTYEQGSPADRVRFLIEGGYGGSLVGAARFSYTSVQDRLIASVRHQPASTASLGIGRLEGTFGDVNWNRRLSPRVSLFSSGEYLKQELAYFPQQNAYGAVELRMTAGKGWSFLTGVRPGYVDQGQSPSVHTLIVPVGASYDGRRRGFSALYRYQEQSLTNRGGSGGRFSARQSWRGLHASAWFDVQRDAATVDLVFREEPALARAFTELGLNTRTPEELAQALRDHPELLQLGYLRGSTLNFAPQRLQAAMEIAWRSETASRQQLRLRLQTDRTDTVSARQETRLGVVSYSRAVSRTLDLFGSLASWSRTTAPLRSGYTTSFEVGARLRVAAAPRLPFGGGKVHGVVFRDDDATGQMIAGSAGVPGARVRVDGAQEVVTDARGRFVAGVRGGGPHRIELLLPDNGGAYFTTPAALMLEAGETAAFGLAHSPARLLGAVRSDCGTAIGGVRVTLSNGERTQEAVTDGGGRYRFTVPAGDYTVVLDEGTLPPGYHADGLAPTRVALTAATPAHADHTVIAERSVSGIVKGDAPATVSVSIVELLQTAPVGGDGRFVFRNLRPGRYTIEVVGSRRTTRHEVLVPDAPATIRIELDDNN